MDTIWAFLSSLLTGVGTALALTAGVALLLHYVARASWIANTLLLCCIPKFSLRFRKD